MSSWLLETRLWRHPIQLYNTGFHPNSKGILSIHPQKAINFFFPISIHQKQSRECYAAAIPTTSYLTCLHPYIFGSWRKTSIHLCSSFPNYFLVLQFQFMILFFKNLKKNWSPFANKCDFASLCPYFKRIWCKWTVDSCTVPYIIRQKQIFFFKQWLLWSRLNQTQVNIGFPKPPRPTRKIIPSPRSPSSSNNQSTIICL